MLRHVTVFKRDESGKPLQMLEAAVDITREKEAEGQLQRMYNELQASEEEIRQRSEEVFAMNESLGQTVEALKNTQAQLIQAEKMASLGQLTAGVAHEINNPINYISVSVYNLRNATRELFEVLDAYDQLAADVPAAALKEQLQRVAALKAERYYEDNRHILRETLDLVGTGAARVTEIVRGLRNFSRLDEAVVKMADVHEGLNSSLLLLSFLVQTGIQVVKQYTPHGSQIECYPGLLNQVFMNVLTNAIQSMKTGGVLTLTTLDEGDHLVIRIEDTGEGIPAQLQTRIFEPFFTTKPTGQGTGLGLSISYSIIQRHRGQIHLVSSPGEGTSVTITLPKVLGPIPEACLTPA